MDAAINEMPEGFTIRQFLTANRAEVKHMFLTEYDEERERELLRREVRQETKEETENEVNERVAKDMLRDKKPLKEILRYSKLPEAAIRKLAQSIGVAVL